MHPWLPSLPISFGWPLPLCPAALLPASAEKKPVVKVDLTEGDQILVTAGPFKDFQGEVIEVSGERSKLKALLSIFGRETPVELEFSQISKQS